MPKLLQINVTANWGSTGKIADQCNHYAKAYGWECYEIFGRYQNPSMFVQIKVGSSFIVYEHYFEHRLFDNEGLASRCATRLLVKKIKSINPDVVHLHNIHDHWINYRILFEYLNKTEIKVVWTFHDFWAITGGCSHFVYYNCNKYISLCTKCPYHKGKLLPIIKQTKRNFILKRKLFLSNKNLTIVPVSEWVGDNVRKSFVKDNDIRVISNGVDVDIFKPTLGYFCQEINNDKFVILAVSSQWKSGEKGLDDYITLSSIISKDEVIVLVGVTDEIIEVLPPNIIGISRTNNQHELAALYTRANVVTSFSSAETFGLTIVEGYACGTPAVVYDNTALPSLITPKTGFVVKNKDYKEAYNAIQIIKNKGKQFYTKSCIKLAREKYSKDLCYKKYVELYNELITNNH